MVLRYRYFLTSFFVFVLSFFVFVLTTETLHVILFKKFF